MDEQNSTILNRRTLLTAAGALAATAATARVALAQDHDEHGESHGGSHGVPKNATLHKAALDCVRTGEDCTEHCIESFKAGDTTLAECAALVRELVISCTALAQLAAAGSEHLALFARAARQVCTSCKAECDKHAAHHQPCAACAESCAACIKECEAFAA